MRGRGWEAAEPVVLFVRQQGGVGWELAGGCGLAGCASLGPGSAAAGEGCAPFLLGPALLRARARQRAGRGVQVCGVCRAWWCPPQCRS